MRPVDDNPPVEKLFYRIGEVAKMLGVEPSTVRFWERAYPGLRPRRSTTGQRVYSQRDLQRLRRIKELRYERGLTSRGTLRALRNEGVVQREASDPVVVENQRLRQSLLDVRARIVAFLDQLDQESAKS